MYDFVAEHILIKQKKTMIVLKSQSMRMIFTDFPIEK